MGSCGCQMEVIACKFQKRIRFLMTIMMACFLTQFTGSSLNMSLPVRWGKEFGASTSALSWIIESFLMTSMVLIVPMGRLSDGWGRKCVSDGDGVIYVVVYRDSFCNVGRGAHRGSCVTGHSSGYVVCYEYGNFNKRIRRNDGAKQWG